MIFAPLSFSSSLTNVKGDSGCPISFGLWTYLALKSDINAPTFRLQAFPKTAAEASIPLLSYTLVTILRKLSPSFALTLSHRARRSRNFPLTATKAGLRRLASFEGR
ncbi:hypothetical protein AVEN_89042-1 [Araneus ventricosus]|uniref:Uncharacterized protein n=1 Tax=Araneus ventricosus TaxID=182803 RepID=A0A4Y2B2B4_ARAVE|nr:hypothetical protein AVEN_89042-1 [Araneus ventricosus]